MAVSHSAFPHYFRYFRCFRACRYSRHFRAQQAVLPKALLASIGIIADLTSKPHRGHLLAPLVVEVAKLLLLLHGLPGIESLTNHSVEQQTAQEAAREGTQHSNPIWQFRRHWYAEPHACYIAVPRPFRYGYLIVV